MRRDCVLQTSLVYYTNNKLCFIHIIHCSNMTVERARCPDPLVYSKYHVKDGDFEYELSAVDSVGFPFLSAAFGDEECAYPDIIRTVIDIETRPDDVLLATYQKCGMCVL